MSFYKSYVTVLSVLMLTVVILIIHRASSRKRIIAKRPPTASEQKKTKRGMNDAVNRALEICNMNNEGSGQN